MITIIYDPNAHSPSVFSPRDGQINEHADEIESIVKEWDTLENNPELELTISVFLLIEEVRARIKEGKINYQSVQFKFGNELILVNKDANLSSWPRGFGDQFEEIVIN